MRFCKKIAARDSCLSRAQFYEWKKEYKKQNSQIILQPIWVETMGDRDRTTSLRDLGASNFFTKEIDDLLLARKCDAALHSAKDLPDPLPDGLSLAYLTKGIDPSDSLVLRESEMLSDGSIIATSSYRREEAVRALGKQVHFVDIRGKIEERLAKLWKKEIDGVVIAEAALIRLNLVHLNRITLPGETAPLQGKLALVIRSEDVWKKTFCI